ncbi:MAG TPA: thioredoxin domain-containing protein [Verrucomicrobiota bacterium]|nr:thioredoxin domain-containing protein [Verrucomicrobiota bacterium]
MSTNNSSAHILQVSQADFDVEVLRAALPVLVAFLADWSQPCRVLSPVLERIAAMCADRLKVVAVNADDNPELSLWHNIQSVPTLLCFSAGRLIGSIVGTATEGAILARFEGLVTPPDRHSPRDSKEGSDV